VLQLVPEELARKHVVLPIRQAHGRLLVAMADPFDYYAVDDLQMVTKQAVQPLIGGRKQIELYIDRFYHEEGPPAEAHRDEGAAVSTPAGDLDAPVVRLVNQLLHRAIAEHASDIHVEPTGEDVRVRFRVDGQLALEQTVPAALHSPLLARIKVMAGLDIADKRLPQDGRLHLEDRPDVDVRVSTLPTVFGEKAVLRILDRSQSLLDVKSLALSPANEARLARMTRNTSGMVLITGPTGSGKTTTLYALLKAQNTVQRNIVTIEDPVEYQLPGTNQTQVNPAIGYTFSRGLRAILRQDPDVVMVGEIRDEETAEIAIRGALTGHFMMSTMHTPDAPSAVLRLTDMGVEPYLVAASLVGVMGQRLIRQVCPDCRHPAVLTDLERAYLEREHFAPVDSFVTGAGCARCRFTGYRGRLAIHEFLVFDEEFRRYTLERATQREFRARMNALGYHSLAWDGLEKAAAGLTTVDEVLRATLRE
jgi:type IV pilus assembly protein PilB